MSGPAPEVVTRTVAVLERTFGVTAGLLGAALVSAATIIDRAFAGPSLYESPRDFLLYFAAEFLAGALLWLVLRAGLWILLSLGQALPGDAEQRRRGQRYVTLAVGVVIALSLYHFVVRPSNRSNMLPPAGWAVVLVLLGCAVSFGSYALFRLRLPARSTAYGALLLSVAIALHIFALHRYFRHYGNLHSLVLVVTAVLAALGVGLLLSKIAFRTGRSLRAGVGLLFVASIVALLVLAPSYSTRSAVLVWGGAAKRLLLAVAWPALDRDGDGAPSVLWGVDPDDDDPKVSALAFRDRGSQPDEVIRIEKGSVRRNLLWIVIDTLRVDSFERIVAERGGKPFADFTYYTSYRTCSSRTGQVLSQLLGPDRCDRRRVAGVTGNSLLENLRAEGYEDRLIGYFPLQVSFSTTEHLKSDSAIAERAARFIQEPASRPRALFVHFRGGHAPYEARGDTERERYENMLRASLDTVTYLLDRTPGSWSVIVLGDHGEEFGEHGSHAHATTLYQEVLRTPLLVRSPATPAGRRSETIGCTAVPWKTLEAVGVLSASLPPEGFQYAALDIARGEFGYLRDAQLRSLEMNHKKVIWSPDLGIWELYDLEHDPGETRSLAQLEPDLLPGMQRKLRMLSAQCGHLRTTDHVD